MISGRQQRSSDYNNIKIRDIFFQRRYRLHTVKVQWFRRSRNIKSYNLSPESMKTLGYFCPNTSSTNYCHFVSNNFTESPMLCPMFACLFLSKEAALLIIFEYPEYCPFCHRDAIHSSGIEKLYLTFLNFINRDTIQSSTRQLYEFQPGKSIYRMSKEKSVAHSCIHFRFSNG